MATIKDDFNRADATDLGANWSPGYVNPSTVKLGVLSNQLYLVSSDAAGVAGRWNANTFGNAQYTQVKVAALPADENTWMPIGALQVTANAYNFYGLCYRHSSSNGYTFRIYNNSSTPLYSITHQLSTNDVVRFEYDGVDTLTVKVNGSTVGTYTDPGIPRTGNGYIGLFSYYMPAGDTWKLDDFEGGDLVAASPTITLTPDPASVQVGGTRTFTATRSAPAGAGGVTYNVSSDNPAVATAPTPQALTEADSDLTFDATGVSVGTANITITNAADSSETDTVALTVTAVTTKRAKFLVHPDFASATGITIEVNEAPTGGALTGAKLGFTTGVAAEATLEGGQAVIKVNAADVGASALAAGTSVRAIFKGLAASGSALGSGAEAGSVVVATGTIIEE